MNMGIVFNKKARVTTLNIYEQKTTEQSQKGIYIAYLHSMWDNFKAHHVQAHRTRKGIHIQIHPRLSS